MARSKATSTETRKQVYEEKLFRAMQKASYFAPRFFSKDGSSIVHEKTNLEKEKGDTINFGLLKRLTGPGVTGNQTMKGNEEAISTPGNSVTLERYRNAVKDDGSLERQKASFDLNDEMSAALKVWGAEKIDQLCFDALGIGANSTAGQAPTLIAYPNSSAAFTLTSSTATAKSGMDAANSKLTFDFLTKLKAFARTGGDRRYEPLKPILVDGKNYYVLITSEDAVSDLKLTSDYKNANLYAQERGKDNPLFQGADAIWNGIVIHTSEFCYQDATAGGGTVPYTKSAFLGKQALMWAWGERPSIVEEDEDYEEFIGKCWRMTAGVKKAAFESKDFGSIGVWLSRTNISGATVS